VKTPSEVSLDVTIEIVHQACTQWTYTECFDGENEKTCEKCNAVGGGTDYLVKWKPSDNVTSASQYKYVVRWGPALFWNNNQSLLIPTNSSSSKYLDKITKVCCFVFIVKII